jgi:hypothetical protein
VEAVQQAVKSWKEKEWEVMGLDALIDARLYMRSRRQCDNSLPERKDVFLFQPSTQSGRMIKELKSLKV